MILMVNKYILICSNYNVSLFDTFSNDILYVLRHLMQSGNGVRHHDGCTWYLALYRRPDPSHCHVDGCDNSVTWIILPKIYVASQIID